MAHHPVEALESQGTSNADNAYQGANQKMAFEWQEANAFDRLSGSRSSDKPVAATASSLELKTWSYFDHVDQNGPTSDIPIPNIYRNNNRNSGGWNYFDHSNRQPNSDRRLNPFEGNQRYENGDRNSFPQDQRHAANLMNAAAQEAGNVTGRMVRTSQGVYLKSNFDVDVDGSPRARQIDKYGQTQTSWFYSHAKGHKYINAEKVPYIVLPLGKYKQFGIKLGDYALVRDKGTNKMAVAVFADAGPKSKTGEGSIYLGNEELGLNVTPNRGVSQKRFEYLVFPGSSEGRPRNEQELLSRISNFKQRVMMA